MIIIIKHGFKYQPKYRIKCCNCKCEFSYNDNDRHGYCNLYKDEYVTCPDCKKWLLHKFSINIKEIYD